MGRSVSCQNVRQLIAANVSPSVGHGEQHPVSLSNNPPSERMADATISRGLHCSHTSALHDHAVPVATCTEASLSRSSPSATAASVIAPTACIALAPESAVPIQSLPSAAAEAQQRLPEH